MSEFAFAIPTSPLLNSELDLSNPANVLANPGLTGSFLQTYDTSIPSIFLPGVDLNFIPAPMGSASIYSPLGQFQGYQTAAFNNPYNASAAITPGLNGDFSTIFTQHTPLYEITIPSF